MDPQNTSLDLLQSDAQLQILNDIDKLRSLGIKDLISLPQIVVCGDTSSGKSSLLQALSGVAFPVGSDVCTKFATELILRRAPTESAIAKIRPREGATKEHSENVSTLSHKLSHLDRDAMEKLIDDAKVCMGIKDSGDMSNDVLQLTVSGPTKPNLTLVDLPGIIHSSSNVTDVRKVDTLVRSYMKEPRSMILVVVSGSNPAANQKVLSISHEYDPEGARSIGVLTKPDLLDFVDPESSSGQKLLELAQNEHERFRYQRPWHVLRCPTPSERHNAHFDQQNVEQELFSQAPWDTFDRSCLGVDNLRNSLCDYLLQQIRLELPGVISEIRMKIRVTTHVVEELGPSRTSSGEQRRYLTHISRRYEQLVRAALAGDYLDENEQFFAQQSTRLRAELRTLTDAFEIAMRTRGHTNTLSAQSPSVLVPVVQGSPKIIKKTEALRRADALIKSYRGSELPGMFNPTLVGKLFKEQSVNWGPIAREYSLQVCMVTSKFISKLLTQICPTNSHTANLLLTDLFDRAMQEREQAIEEKITELMTPYTVALPFSTKARLEASLRSIDQVDKKELGDISESQLVGINDIAASSQLLQWSRAYYNVALENLIDNVAVLGIENCIAAKLPHLFSSDTVAEMSDQRLQVLGGESAQISSQRVSEHRKLNILKQSLETCSKHVNRELELKNKALKGLTRELEALSPAFNGVSERERLATTPTLNFASLPASQGPVQPESQDGKVSGLFSFLNHTSPVPNSGSLQPISVGNSDKKTSKPVVHLPAQVPVLPAFAVPPSGTVASTPAPPALFPITPASGLSTPSKGLFAPGSSFSSGGGAFGSTPVSSGGGVLGSNLFSSGGHAAGSGIGVFGASKANKVSGSSPSGSG